MSILPTLPSTDSDGDGKPDTFGIVRFVVALLTFALVAAQTVEAHLPQPVPVAASAPPAAPASAPPDTDAPTHAAADTDAVKAAGGGS